MKENFEEIVWCSKQLFDKRLVTGSTGNISFSVGEYMYISQSGTCFGLVRNDSFAKVKLNGEIVSGKPSKEYPIHLALYKLKPDCKFVIHTHSFYSVLISCKKSVNEILEQMLSTTPYLSMLTKGNIKVIDYYPPGSDELFSKTINNINQNTNVYLLKNHGVFVSEENMIKAYSLLEEFETSAKLWHFLNSTK